MSKQQSLCGKCPALRLKNLMESDGRLEHRVPFCVGGRGILLALKRASDGQVLRRRRCSFGGAA